MKIYLTRHGQTEWNLQGKLQGSSDSKLTCKGIEEAHLLGERLKDIKFDSIYSSPLERAYDTAKYIKRDRDIDIITCDCFKEMNFGTWEGIPRVDIERMYREKHYNFWNMPHLFIPLDGEFFDEFVERIRKCFLEIVNNEKGENILIVVHTAVIKAIYSIVKNYTVSQFWDPPFIKNTCLSIIEINKEEMKFILEADISHLNN